ncbi:MAG: radical SAM protein [Trueperaceae bacterium]|nr:MAG: radical SAM protein [Trueperaceae bacterium]
MIAKRLANARIQVPVALSANLGVRYDGHNLHRFYTCDWPLLRDATSDRAADHRPPLRRPASRAALHRFVTDRAAAGRGCHFHCDFSAVQTVFAQLQTRRPVDDVLDEIRRIKDHHGLRSFSVDDYITSNMLQSTAFVEVLAPLNVRWVSQASINAAREGEFLELLVRSGRQGVLIGFECMDPRNLAAMGKGFDALRGRFEVALANLRRHELRLYGAIVFGYDHDTPDAFDATVDFAHVQRCYMAASNHLTPFPGTPLYERLECEGRLRFERWRLDPDAAYNVIPLDPTGMAPGRRRGHPSTARPPRAARPRRCLRDDQQRHQQRRVGLARQARAARRQFGPGHPPAHPHVRGHAHPPARRRDPGPARDTRGSPRGARLPRSSWIEARRVPARRRRRTAGRPARTVVGRGAARHGRRPRAGCRGRVGPARRAPDGGVRRLPAVESPLRVSYASLLCVADDDPLVATRLVQTAVRRAADHGPTRWR